jgi:L-threonylcarbamoyladenylate synthase
MRTIASRRMKPAIIADAVATVVQHGGLVIFPTDTVYGIGCDPLQRAAVARIFAAKGRPAHKPLSLHFGSVEELLEYAPGNSLAAAAARAFLPGPLTIVVRRLPFVGEWVAAGLATIGLRVPKHALCATILDRCGPLAATSANHSGDPAYTGFGGTAALPSADLCIDDGATRLQVESTVVDVSQSALRLVREGAVTIAMLEDALGRVIR